MKKYRQLLIAIFLFSLFLSACRVQPTDRSTQDDSERSADTDTIAAETAYPAGEYKTVQETMAVDAAYPIKEEDLDLLYKTWESSAYLEDGSEQNPKILTLRFSADGAYEMTTDSGTITGEWTPRLSSLDSNLILKNKAGNTQNYEIIKLEESLLILQYWQENVQIEQQFQPVN